MGDLISRQAVKNMVDTWTYDMMDPEDVERALHDVDKLPDAQPSEGDIISRQAAIDALNGQITVRGKDNAIAVQEYIRIVNLKLRELPSTEPEIIHCRDCENLKIDGIYHDCWCDGRKVWLDFYCGNAKRKNGGGV